MFINKSDKTCLLIFIQLFTLSNLFMDIVGVFIIDCKESKTFEWNFCFAALICSDLFMVLCNFSGYFLGEFLLNGMFSSFFTGLIGYVSFKKQHSTRNSVSFTLKLCSKSDYQLLYICWLDRSCVSRKYKNPM